MTAPNSKGSWSRALGLALLAFVLAFVAVTMGWGQGHFLVSAYHHAGI
ncbi:hypothetical protein LBMAG42_23490 [Deltaproteobacteria bacterium]|nr:hypothetical protein LBMAG42_23490 [Deltaproteobacteria bacterium]